MRSRRRLNNTVRRLDPRNVKSWGAGLTLTYDDLFRPRNPDPEQRECTVAGGCSGRGRRVIPKGQAE